MTGGRHPGLTLARAVADAVLYEGYLLYPYRASAQKNQARWQFGILGPPGAAAAGVGEEPQMLTDALLRVAPSASAARPGAVTVSVCVRFLQLQTRTVERAVADGNDFEPVSELQVNGARWLSWDEAVPCELELGPFALEQLERGLTVPLSVPAGEDLEWLPDSGSSEKSGRPGAAPGRLVRRRRALSGSLRLTAEALSDQPLGGDLLLRLRVAVENVAAGVPSVKADAVATSFIGTHLLVTCENAGFVSVLDPPVEAQASAAECVHERCWPVLAGPEGQDDVLLASPIILYDHPSVAPESAVALFDSTEIDEILTLRVLTLTEEEKAEARVTDPRAAAIIDRCEALTVDELEKLHGALRSPRVFEGAAAFEIEDPGDVPWWSPEADESVRPDQDVVVIDGVPVARGSRVRLHPRRHADAQDLFSAGEIALVAGVHFDVDGSTHVAVTLEIDPAADLHDWFGRYLYFAPDELEPLEPPDADFQQKGRP
ncbi:hypothetical protein E3T55_02805 [Cryobacterium frigoriphilum]|uniref:Uncharacterized protein n=1 Tax=Cryobacterium frigoriphilum TaxID=1259150 RepID=A0A4R9A9V9_9MICO|nr:hypothetical protein [Cryobacterium frigoriphilum]TFD54736.1 hypothetical protein E3T55_02805 [Cryobacterium frigoriphilum]